MYARQVGQQSAAIQASTGHAVESSASGRVNSSVSTPSFDGQVAQLPRKRSAGNRALRTGKNYGMLSTWTHASNSSNRKPSISSRRNPKPRALSRRLSHVLLGLLNGGATLAEMSEAEFEVFIEDFSEDSEHFPPLPPDFSRADIYTDHYRCPPLRYQYLSAPDNKADPAHTLAIEALRTLRRRREMLCFMPQVLAEFWSVCTARAQHARLRPPTLEAERRAQVVERYFRLLPDSVTTYQEWRQLLVRHTVAGVKVHDARLIASMKVYDITHLLTFNTEDFTRYPNIIVVAPQHVPQT